MAAYEPPTLAELIAYVGRDLTDPESKVWNVEQKTDYINGGIAELNRIRPLEATEVLLWDEDAQRLPLKVSVLESVFHVELLSVDAAYQQAIPYSASGVDTRTGWDFYAQSIWLGPTWLARAGRTTQQGGSLVLMGYRSRDPLLVEDDVAEFLDLTEEMFVRLYCRMEAYRAMNMDRSIFQQWQQQANNSDVSPTQLNGMLGTAEASFDRQQRRMFLPRRIPAF
jgi:hypothetical protein